MINNNTNDKGSETQSTNSSDSLSVEETKELLKGMGCWCPGYESHPTKRGICRNCGHSEADHDKKDGFCNYDGSYSTDYGNSSSDSKQQEEKRQREEEKSRVRRGHINTEILETERSYVAVLRKIKVYREELESCLDEKTIWDLFSNSDSLLELHENLLSKLEQCVQMHKIIASSLLSPAENGSGTSNASMARGTMAVDDEPCFGPIFVAIAPMFRLYKMYAAAHDNAVKVIHTIVGKEEVLKVCRGIMGDPDAPPHSAVLDLNSLLIAPIQRIPRYLLLMQDLIKHTPPGSENYVALTKAHEIVQEVAGEVNTYVKVEEDMNKVIQIQQLLVGDFPPLYGKRFIYEGDLNKITSKLIVKCHIFLFDDVIVYSHTKIGSFWRYKGTIELGTAWVRVLKGGRTYKNVFQIVGPKKTWTFYANSPEELNVWLDNLNGAISALVEKDPSLVDKRANVSVKMGHGLWRMLSISRRKDYDKQFSETLKSDETKDITAQTPPPPPPAAEPEKKDDKDKDKGVDENRTDDTASPSVNVPKTVEKEGPLADEKKPTEVLPERPKVEEIPSEPPKSITPKLTKSESSMPQSTTAAVAANSPRGSSEERSGKESAAKLSRSGERPVALPPQATATTTHSSSYSAIIRNSAPTPVVMQEEFDEDYEGNSLLGGPKKPKSQSSSWCCC